MPRLGVRRPRQALDRILGAAFRRTEVRYGFAMNLVLPAVGAFQLYEEVAGPIAFDISRAMHLGLVCCVTVGILRLAQFARPQAGPGEPGSSSPLSARTFRLAAPRLVPPLVRP
jgi:hypothetical protein